MPGSPFPVRLDQAIIDRQPGSSPPHPLSLSSSTSDWLDVSSTTTQSVAQLRSTNYNATLTERIDITPDLFRIRIRPDGELPRFEPGQYVVLGLGYWEPRVQPSQRESVPEKKLTKLIRRAYSISCPMFDGEGGLLTCQAADFWEFYVALVRGDDADSAPPPALTPRLFGLTVGDRLFVGSKITGTYTLAGVAPTDTVCLIATGTGEAPHNAMVTELLSRGHTGKILNVTTVRHRRDAGYRAEQQRLMDRYENYRYLLLTTREPENLDPKHPDFVGRQYVQDLFTSGRLAELVGDPLSPDNTHAYLCGNPAMIGFVPPGGQPLTRPGMLTLLQHAGFTAEEPGCGHVRFEKYW